MKNNSTKSTSTYHVVFVFAKNRGEKSTRFAGFAKRLQNNGHLKNCVIETVALEDIIFDIANGKNTNAFVNGKDPFIEADMVYFKSWESDQETASALAALLKARGIPYIDQSVGGVGVSKLPMMVRLWGSDVLVPRTIYGKYVDAEYIIQTVGFPCIVKAAHGQKGLDNYLVKSVSEFNELLEKIELRKFIIQQYIPNNGDYRIWSYASRVRGGLFRRAGKGHVHNTSQGADSELLDERHIPEELKELAIGSAKAMHLSISGVDVMQHADSGKYYVLEANQGSQVVTGAFVEDKMSAFASGFEELLQKRHLRKKTPLHKLDVVGRHVAVDFPDWGVEGMIGKIDTGAYQAALHAEDIHEEDGVLSFTVSSYEDRHGKRIDSTVQTSKEYSFAEVRNTSGVLEKRYLVPVRFVIRGRIFNSKVSLTNRGTMKYPLLIGRRTLRGRFLVNSELSKRTSL